MKFVLEPYVKKNFLSPQSVIKELGLGQGDVVIDFGSGAGFWSIPLAQEVGKEGRVYVTDPIAENLQLIKMKAAKFGLSNIHYEQAPYNSEGIPVKVKADLILISNVLSVIDSDEKLIKSTVKNAHADTKLVVVDWNKESKLGPKEHDRPEVEQVIIWAQKAGFCFKKLLDAGEHHFGLYFEFEGGK